jgi:hypothetical protein
VRFEGQTLLALEFGIWLGGCLAFVVYKTLDKELLGKSVKLSQKIHNDGSAAMAKIFPSLHSGTIYHSSHHAQP